MTSEPPSSSGGPAGYVDAFAAAYRREFGFVLERDVSCVAVLLRCSNTAVQTPAGQTQPCPTLPESEDAEQGSAPFPIRHAGAGEPGLLIWRHGSGHPCVVAFAWRHASAAVMCDLPHVVRYSVTPWLQVLVDDVRVRAVGRSRPLPDEGATAPDNPGTQQRLGRHSRWLPRVPLPTIMPPALLWRCRPYPAARTKPRGAGTQQHPRTAPAPPQPPLQPHVTFNPSLVNPPRQGRCRHPLPRCRPSSSLAAAGQRPPLVWTRSRPDTPFRAPR